MTENNDSMLVKCFRTEFTKKNFLLSYDWPENFTRCYFQKSKEILPEWIGYHGLMACYFTISFIFTVTPQMHQNKFEILDKYYIFLTHWTYVFETFYFIVGLIIVSFLAYKEGNMVASSERINDRKMTWYLKAYWVMHTIIAPATFTVTLIFWVFIYNPEKFELDANNLIQHAINSVMMLIHIILIDHPVRVFHFYMPLIYGFIYAIFSVTYQLNGGTGTKGNIPIYSILDWRKPIAAAIVCILSSLLLVILHLMFYTFFYVKSYLKERKDTEIV